MELTVEVVRELVVVIMAIIALVKYALSLRHQEKINKLEVIKKFAIEIHDIVEKIAPHTKTKKDDLFVERSRVLLEGFGLELKKSEEAAVKLIGEGVHQDRKGLEEAIEDSEDIVK